MPGYAKIPGFVSDQIARCVSDTFYVGRARTFSTADLAGGVLTNLGVGWDGVSVTHTESIVPPIGNGRWSKYNVDGRQNVRKDLPKVDKVIGGWQTPNFGDWDKGSHTHSSVRRVFQRETWYAQQLGILIDAGDPLDGQVPMAFRVDRVFDRNNLNERDLRLAISLLRENIHAHASIVPTQLSVADWLADQRVTWEILPRGEASFGRVVERLKANPSSPRIREMQDRYQAIDSMHPGAVVVGDGEFSRYFGFKFRDDLVVLENLDYGNALYAMYEDWSLLSQRSRVDLLADANAHYDRIIHRAGWQDRLKLLLILKGHDVTGA